MKDIKFNKPRLYKLVKGTVILLSVLFISSGVTSLVNSGDFSRSLKTSYNQCIKIENDYLNFNYSVCHGYIDSITNNNNWILYKFLIGTGLLTVFYGGSWIYKYLFPLREDKNE